jgi:beta-glucanase (GH16 family)
MAKLLGIFDATVEAIKERDQRWAGRHRGLVRVRPMGRLLTALTFPAFLLAQPPPQAAGYTLTFADEFTGTALDTSKWQTSWPWGSGIDSTYPADQGLPQNLTVANGVASFAVTRGSTPSGATYGSAVATSLFSQKYGYWEANVKMPVKAHGLWPAFWLVAADGSWPPEIDIMEWYGNQPAQDDMTVHYGSSNATAEYLYTDLDFSAGYHTLGMLWTPISLTWYVDNAQIFTTTSGVPTRPMKIILNNDTCVICTWPSGAGAGNAVDSTTSFPAVFSVDYVHVFSPGTMAGTAPSMPRNLKATATSTQVTLSWSASTGSVAGYNVYRDGALLANSTSTSYVDQKVARSTQYVYAVAAFDAAGDVSAQSSSIAATTHRH